MAVVGATAFFLVHSERQISARQVAFRVFDGRQLEVVAQLSGMRAAQQTYVAVGQSVAVRAPEVAALMATITGNLDELRRSAVSADASNLLAEVTARVAEFGDVDRRARDYAQAGDELMAADVVFTEGGDTAVSAARQSEAARLAEQRAFDALASRTRTLEAYALGGAAAFILVVVAALVPRSPTGMASGDAAGVAGEYETGRLIPREAPAEATHESDALPRRAQAPLKEAARLCTELSRVSDVEELKQLLGRAADMMDASGLVVWLGSVGGPMLRPVLAHGYPPQTLAHMPTLQRSADNAAAAAYRTGRFQVVRARPGSAGALVAPLLSPEGCIGALAVEITGDASDNTEALAALFAAQLAGALASSVPATDDEQPRVGRTAAG